MNVLEPITIVRSQFLLTGRLQGVGFRPWIYRLAQQMGVSGWVKNTTQGVEIQLQGLHTDIIDFEQRLNHELPPHALIRSFKKTALPPLTPGKFEDKSHEKFQILASNRDGTPLAEILPDLAVCSECMDEVLNFDDRRYRYAFTNCTYCGPRYSILRSLPYDRQNTTMSLFQMCEPCLKEYHDPLNRRFHAQTQCCIDCGPSLALKDAKGNTLQQSDSALLATAQAIRGGAIVAVQGIGGFHLFCDSHNNDTVRKLRSAKQRVSKPFALMIRDMEQAHALCRISSLEEKLLKSSAAPIVLLRRKNPDNISAQLSAEIAPGIPALGLMLPYTPFHYLLMKELNFPVVATSGNFRDEPICYLEPEAIHRLGALAELFLVHNRTIASRIDDSVVREIAGTEVVFRAGRGYSPQILEISDKSFTDKNFTQNPPIIGLGAHQKNTISFGDCTTSKGSKKRIVLMPHLGNLGTSETTDAYHQSLQQLKTLYNLGDVQFVGDLHPDYRSTQVGQHLNRRGEGTPGRQAAAVDSLGVVPSPLLRVQHHEAHLLSCMAEHGITGEILGVAWDGAGYGLDESIWGGEFLKKTDYKFSRVGHIRPFRLPGGSVAMKDTRRTALGLLFEILGESCPQEAQALGFTENELKILIRALKQEVNSPWTSSVGRLFDGVAALVGLRSTADYEGQPAIELEYATNVAELATDVAEVAINATRVTNGFEPLAYPIQIGHAMPAIVDWGPWVVEILKDRKRGLSIEQISAKFHRTLAESIVLMAKQSGISQVVLSGGCFQNQVLCESTISLLRNEGFTPFWNQKVPPNDGGISVGQVMGGWNVLINSG